MSKTGRFLSKLGSVRSLIWIMKPSVEGWTMKRKQENKNTWKTRINCKFWWYNICIPFECWEGKTIKTNLSKIPNEYFQNAVCYNQKRLFVNIELCVKTKWHLKKNDPWNSAHNWNWSANTRSNAFCFPFKNAFFFSAWNDYKEPSAVLWTIVVTFWLCVAHTSFRHHVHIEISVKWLNRLKRGS